MLRDILLDEAQDAQKDMVYRLDIGGWMPATCLDQGIAPIPHTMVAAAREGDLSGGFVARDIGAGRE